METFTVEKLAKYLKLHEYTIRRLAREGKISIGPYTVVIFSQDV